MKRSTRLAKTIAKTIFTSGDGRRCKRLRMEFDKPPTMPGLGWSEACIASRIEEIIVASGIIPGTPTPTIAKR